MISISSLEASTSNLNIVAGDQHNYTTVVNNSPSPEYVPPQRVNDAPIDLLAGNFLGRLKDLEFLSRVLAVENVATEEDVPTRCAVHGMPGLGKTKLVLRFAEIVFARLVYSHIFWMSSATPDKLVEGMAKILDLVGHPERTRSDQNAKLTAARLWLEDTQRIDGVRWLLILDNVDKSALEFLREHLPRRNVKGSILFTTRAADVAHSLVRVSGGCHSTLDLRVPDLAETTNLLFASAGIGASTVTSTQQNQAEQLVQNLGSLPLAVVQAASYMSQTDMTLDSMLQISTGERKIEMVEWESDLATDQQRSVVATFDTLFDQLERDFPESYNVLRVLSFLDPEGIPLEMLTNGARMSLSPLDKPPPGHSQGKSSMIARIVNWTHNRTLSKHGSQTDASDPPNPIHPSPELSSLISVILSPTTFPKVLHKLQSLSLVEPLSRDGERSLRMHDLVHFMTLEHVQRHTAYQAWLESTVSLVCGALGHVKDPESPPYWPECERVMPHVRSLNKVWANVKGVNLELVNADVRLVHYLNSRGRYDDAERLCERSLGSLRQELGDTHKDTLRAFHRLGQIYYNQRRLTDAKDVFKRMLAVQKEALGPDHEDTLSTMGELARAYRRADGHREAEELFKQILAVKMKTLGADHPRTLKTMHNLAHVYDTQKRYDEAEELYKNVLAHDEKHLGPDHVDTLMTANNLAVVYLAQTKFTDAEALFMRALVGREKQLGISHPVTLTTAMNLAHLYRSQTRNDEAERLYLRVFTGRKRQLGANHPATLRCARHFTALYRSQGRNSEADALLDSLGESQGG